MGSEILCLQWNEFQANLRYAFKKICAPLIISSLHYLLSKIFTNIKVYVQRLANLCQLLWCHSCLWGWTGVKMNKMSLSQTTWRLHGEAKVIIRMIFAGNPGPQDCSFFFQRLFQRLASQVCQEQNYSLKYINTAWTTLHENKNIYHYHITGWFS